MIINSYNVAMYSIFIFLFSQLKCCGLNSFTDYENLFNNLSVPVSCCNTTHPLVNQSTCPEIVTDATLANQTSQIYTEVMIDLFTSHYNNYFVSRSYQGCVSHLESFYQNIFTVVGWYCISWGILLVCHLNHHIIIGSW